MPTLPSTDTRVTRHTAAPVNRRIAERTARQVMAAAASPSERDRRLRALDREWDIERALEANAGALALLGAVLALTVDRRFAVLPAVVGGFLVQHALQGWCPPLPLFRRAGLRTAREIGGERTALKALRGDFEGVTAPRDPGQRALAALKAAAARV